MVEVVWLLTALGGLLERSWNLARRRRFAWLVAAVFGFAIHRGIAWNDGGEDTMD